MDIGNKYITVQEAAEKACIDEGYIRRMLIHDKFKDLKKESDYTKMGRIWLIKKTSWEKHLKNKSKK